MDRLERAVRQATWARSAFGAKAELRRMWQGMVDHGVSEDMHRQIIAFWRMPATDGYCGTKSAADNGGTAS